MALDLECQAASRGHGDRLAELQHRQVVECSGDRNDFSPGRLDGFRLAREERWDKLTAGGKPNWDAIQLAKRIYERMKSDFGLESGS